MNGVGNGSCRHALFKFLKSMHILMPLPYFLSCTTIGLIHYDSSTSSIMPALIIWSISSLTLCLYMGFIIYGHCLIGLSSVMSGIFISPSSPSIPFIFVNFVGNKSLYSHNNFVMLYTIDSS
jgi:hypothetical protein